jgi:hypothetical protein
LSDQDTNPSATGGDINILGGSGVGPYQTTFGVGGLGGSSYWGGGGNGGSSTGSGTNGKAYGSGGGAYGSSGGTNGSGAGGIVVIEY